MDLSVPCKILVQAFKHSRLLEKIAKRVTAVHVCTTEEEVSLVLRRGRFNLNRVLVIVMNPSPKMARSYAVRALLQNGLNYHMYVVVFSKGDLFPPDLRVQFKYVLREE
jgi:hypothetical protein